MTLVSDPEYLIYRMRRSMLESAQDSSLIERIITLPTSNTNDYIITELLLTNPPPPTNGYNPLHPRMGITTSNTQSVLMKPRLREKFHADLSGTQQSGAEYHKDLEDLRRQMEAFPLPSVMPKGSVRPQRSSSATRVNDYFHALLTDPAKPRMRHATAGAELVQPGRSRRPSAAAEAVSSSSSMRVAGKIVHNEFAGKDAWTTNLADLLPNITGGAKQTSDPQMAHNIDIKITKDEEEDDDETRRFRQSLIGLPQPVDRRESHSGSSDISDASAESLEFGSDRQPYNPEEEAAAEEAARQERERMAKEEAEKQAALEAANAESRAAEAAKKEAQLKLLFQKIPPKPILQIASQPGVRRSALGGPVSGISAMLKTGGTIDNPFAAEFSFFNGKGDKDPVKIKVYFPNSTNPLKPLMVIVKKEATVEEVIGYSMFEYVNSGLEPEIPDELCDVAWWNMRIVEDDGTLDEDFPALERGRGIQKFGFDQFAVCKATPDQAKVHEAQRKANPMANRSVMAPTAAMPKSLPVANAAPGAKETPDAATINGSSDTSILLKVHLYSTLEVKQTTTVPMKDGMLMSEVFESICKKRKYDPKNYVLKMPDTKTDVPMDKTLLAVGVTEFCVLKKDRGGAGDIFLRPPDEQTFQQMDQRPFMSEELTSMYRQYNVIQKQIMGRYERVLTIDGEHIHILAPEQKFFEVIKTMSYHISMIVSCKQTKRHSPHFKLIVQKSGSERNTTSYDFEASSQQEAADICTKITFMAQIRQKS